MELASYTGPAIRRGERFDLEDKARRNRNRGHLLLGLYEVRALYGQVRILGEEERST